MQSEPFWRASARCRRENAGYFFPPPHFERKEERSAREQAARSLCRDCPVCQECLDYAMDIAEPHGIWGGMNEMERRRLGRQRGVRPR